MTGIRDWGLGICAQSLIPHPQYLFFALAVVVRIIPWLAGYPLHRDEALYGFWARLIASGRDPLLLTPWIDKPPLVIYLLAGSLKLFGVSELALRLPGMIAGTLLLPVTYALAHRVYDRPTALLAAALVAASPFAILFAPTAFTDPWLALWLAAAAWAAVSGRPFWAGLTLGLAVASKQQGVLGVPLIVGLLMLSDRQTANCKLQTRRRLFAICHLLFGFALILTPLTYWDSLRWHNRPSFWDRSITTYGGIALAPLADWPQRAAGWGELLGYLWGTPVLSALVLGAAAWAGWKAEGGRRKDESRPVGFILHPSSFILHPSSFILLFVLVYLALHFALTFQVWDRYLLPLVPFVAVLAARGANLTPLPPSPAGRGGRLTGPSLAGRGAGGRWAILRANALAARDATADEKRPPGLEALAGLWVSGRNRLKPLVRRHRAIFRAVVHAERGATANENVGPVGNRPYMPIFRAVVHAGRDATANENVGPVGNRPYMPIFRAALILALAPLLVYTSWLGATARIPVGSDHGAFAGVDRVAAFVRTRPAEAIIYHHALGWYFDFYLFDAPQERRWYDAPARLTADARATVELEPGREQWLAVPDWESVTITEAEATLAAAGLRLDVAESIFRPDGSRSFILYCIAQSEATHGD